MADEGPPGERGADSTLNDPSLASLHFVGERALAFVAGGHHGHKGTNR